ncbi:hypothetical protein M409DRAFT_22148 [Zasmidium cellare ATCC 36951]|uniref:Uncharacterized protein n=1 Tax=Zasmidium cellare ATCC 36951 TaxID=1080233 RepID=A0A6A6CM93_ZASCE|nr:uncharacterized protein M409DRAFT_22148 [Zasmidium cellare ATCC 36951]KAF2167338.1 hypothetical protein M409DRAFT_22148 [Zasmidium cellare ATCC 36951]
MSSPPPAKRARLASEAEVLPLLFPAALPGALINAHIHSANRLHILGLIPELRNRIMEMALSSPDDIALSATSPQQPPILRTCSQLRAQYTRVYYTINSLVLSLEAYNGAATVPAVKAFVKHVESPMDLEIIEFLRVEKWWVNLLEWMRLVHAGEMPNFVEGAEQRSGELLVIAQMFGVVEEMKGVDWEITRKVLERFRVLLGEHDVDWHGDPLED